MGNTSLQSNSELQNRSGASFYTMPEAENDALLKENDDLKSQISELEMSMRAETEYQALFKSSEEIEMEMAQYKAEQQEICDALKREIREKEEQILKFDEEIKSLKSTKTSGFMSVHEENYNHVKKQLDELKEEMKKEEEESGSLIKEQRKELDECQKEGNAIRGHGGKLKNRVQELKEELRQATRKLDNI